MPLTPTGVEFLAKGLNSYLRDLSKADKAQLGLGKSADKSSGLFGKLGSAMGATAKVAAGVAVVGVGALAAGVGALATVSTTTAISFEDAFAGVIKTTDGLTSGIGKLNEAGKELRQGFVDLTKTVPLTFEELAAIGELGGQLGIGKDALLDFTETVAALGASTNLSTEEAATGLARISNIFNVSADDMGMNIEQLGSTIVALGNNFATTERDILAFGERLAGAGAIAGLTQADILGIGTAMSSVGVEAEAGGTATQKVLLAINNAVAGTATGFVDYSDKIDKNVGKLTKLNAESARLEAQFPGLQAELLANEKAFIDAGGSAEEFGRQLGDKARQKAFETAKAIQELQTETDLLRQQHGKPVDSNLLSTFASTANLTANEFQQLWEKDASEAFRLFVEGLGAQGDDAVNTLADLGLEDQRLIRAFLSLAGAGDLLERTLVTANSAWEENSALANEAAQRYATTQSKIAIFQNVLRSVADSIGTRLLPVLNQLIDYGTSLIEQYSGPMLAALDGLLVAFDNVTAAFSGFLATGSTTDLLTALGLSPDQIELVMTGFSTLQSAFGQFVQFWVTNWPNIQAAALTAWEVIQAVVAGVVAAVQPAIQSLGQSFGEIGLILNQLGIDWGDVFNALLQATIIVIGGITAAIVGIISVIASLVNAFAQGFAVIIDTVNSLAAPFEQFVTGIVQLWQGDFYNGIINTTQGLANLVNGLFAGMINTVLAAVQGFVDSMIAFWEGLYNYLVGGSIVPDLINSIIAWFTMLPGAILNALSGLTSAVGDIFASLFGGGTDTGPSFNTDAAASVLAVAESVAMLQANFNALLLSIQNFIDITLILLQETFTIVLATMLEQVILFWQTAIIPLDLALISIYTVTLPTLLATTIAAITAMIAVVNTLALAFTAMGEAAGRAAEKIVDDMEDAADAINNLIDIVKEAEEAFRKMAEAAREAARAASSAGSASGASTGIGFAKGIGFMRGIGLQDGLGLGYTIPGQGRGDTFGPMFLEPGEEILVTPRGMTIDSLVMDRLAGMINGGGDRNNTFNMTVNTLASPQSVIQQYQVAKALIG